VGRERSASLKVSPDPLDITHGGEREPRSRKHINDVSEVSRASGERLNKIMGKRKSQLLLSRRVELLSANSPRFLAHLSITIPPICKSCS